MRSGLARCFGCALIAVLASCNSLMLGEQVQRAIVDGGAPFDESIIDMPPDMFVEGGPPDVMVPPDAMISDGPVDAPIEGGPDALVDAPMEGGPDAPVDAPMEGGIPDGGVPDAGVPDAGPPDDGGPGDGSLSDALLPDAREPPGLPVGGSHDDQIQSFYACSTGDGASALPLLLAILALRRRWFRGSGVT